MGFAEIFAQYRKLADTRNVEVTQADLDNYRKLLKGGFSHNVATGEAPKSGYMVGVHQSKGGVNHVFSVSELTPQKLAEHRQEIEQKHRDDPGVYQGGWIEGDKVYLDSSRNIHDRAQAIQMGQQHNQKAIYHIDKDEDIPTGGTGE